MAERQSWILRSITRIREGLHEIVFDVDGHPPVKLTIEGSFSLKGCGVEHASLRATLPAKCACADSKMSYADWVRNYQKARRHGAI